MHVYKSRKKKKSKTKQPLNKPNTNHTKEHATNYQQTDLHGENIDSLDGETFGDKISTRGDNTI